MNPLSPIVTPTKKDGSIRLCIDMREPNKAIIRERHNMPTLDEITRDLIVQIYHDIQNAQWHIQIQKY